MLIRSGVDLVRISRIEAAFERRGEAFLERFMTASEKEACRREDGSWRFERAAARYAAKEAFAKALGTGIAEGVSFSDIEVSKDERGAPFYRLSGEAEARFRGAGFKSSSLSLTHDGDYAAAFCVLYGDPEMHDDTEI